MAQATSGEKTITIDGQKYKVRTQINYQTGLGVQGTLSTTAPIRYVAQYLPQPSLLNPIPDWTNLGERDTTNPNNWIFTPVAGAGFQKALIANGPNSLTTSLDTATINALSKSAGVTKQQASQVLQVAPNVSSTVPAQIQPTAAAQAATAATAATDDISRAGSFAVKTGVDISPSIDSAVYRKEYAKGYPNNEYYYPIDLASNKQDRIKFTMKSNEGSTINTKFGEVNPFKRKEGTTITGSVTLPIQPSISDSNTVDWSGTSLNPVAAAAAGAALQLIRSDNAFQLNQNAAAIMSGVMKALRSKDAQNAMNIYFAQEAVGIQGLLSRTTGAVLNPNLELLFGGPTLRSFGFTFRLSPRELKEANAVREIIRFFKQGMAVKKGKSSAFLKSPNIFDIKYLAYDNNGALIEHPSINRIKTCALIGCDVDYTPDGTYMTFVDGSRTMTSYQLTLRFSELDPIYESDYGDNSPIPNSHIGY